MGLMTGDLGVHPTFSTGSMTGDSGVVFFFHRFALNYLDDASNQGPA